MSCGEVGWPVQYLVKCGYSFLLVSEAENLFLVAWPVQKPVLASASALEEISPVSVS